MPKTFRVIATMNLWDKTSLFRLSYAVQRRFAIIHVGHPAPETYASILERVATEGHDDPRLPPSDMDRVIQLFGATQLLRARPVGAAIPMDMIRYMRRRQAAELGLAEALAVYLLPQLAKGLAVDLYLHIDRARNRTDLDEHLEHEVATFFAANWPFGNPQPTVYVAPRTIDPALYESLHAKCVVVDERVALLGSANITDRGQSRNIEVGARIEDAGFAHALVAQFRAATAAGVFCTVEGRAASRPRG